MVRRGWVVTRAALCECLRITWLGFGFGVGVRVRVRVRVVRVLAHHVVEGERGAHLRLEVGHRRAVLGLGLGLGLGIGLGLG